MQLRHTGQNTARKAYILKEREKFIIADLEGGGREEMGEGGEDRRGRERDRYRVMQRERGK